MSDEQIRPDFVILGVPAEDAVYVYASQDLTKAELEAVVEEERVRSLADWRPPRREYTLTATMKAFTVARGETYADAFRALFESWTPPERRPYVLPGAPRSIGGTTP